MRSALLELPGAVARGDTADGHPDAAVAWHYGDPLGEQRAAGRSAGLIDLSHREIIAVTGEDRLTWLNSLTSQDFLGLVTGSWRESLLLSPQGHVEHWTIAGATDDTVYLETEPGRGTALLGWLEQMRFWSKVELELTDLGTLAVVGPDAAELTRALDDPAIRVRRDAAITAPRSALPGLAVASGVRPIGSWAADALRIPTRVPRFGIDTDDRTIPNEVSWLRTAVHLDKGCYRGQETVARVNNLGRPPRRLVVLNLDGSVDRLPATGDDVLTATGPGAGRVVGRVGTVAHHHELGPIALALAKRSVPLDVPLLAGGVDALIDPDGYTDPADQGADATPRSVVDRRAFPDIRRR